MKTARKRMVIAGVLLVAGLLLAGGSVLHAHFGPHWGPGCRMAEDHASFVRYQLTQKLDLDASQQQELEAIARDLLAKGAGLHQMRADARQEALSILRADSVDAARIERLVTRHREEISELMTTAGTKLTEFVNMLTPEQRQRLAGLIEERAGCSP